MSKRIIAIVLVIMVFALAGCGQKNPLRSFSKDCGIDLSEGEIIFYEDNHGGFHGDGFSLLIADYSQSPLVEEEFDSNDLWHRFPLPDSLNTFVYQPYDSALQLPLVENGYYYFYNRHSEATDPYDASKLLQGFSFNFTFAIYDLDTNILYLCKYDT